MIESLKAIIPASAWMQHAPFTTIDAYFPIQEEVEVNHASISPWLSKLLALTIKACV